MKQTPDLDRIQANMAPGILTLKGFLGDEDRKLADILADDQLTLANLGVSLVQIVRRLEEISAQAVNLMEEERTIEDRFVVKVRDDRGLLPCPWGDGRFEKGDTEVHDQKTGRVFRWNPLTLHMIQAHGFFSGRGSEFRLEPAVLAETFGLWVSRNPQLEDVQKICSRHSVRRFTAEVVGDDCVEAMLRAAMQAPSAANEQPWQFLVVRDRKLLNAVPEFHPYAKMLMDTTVAILVCNDERLEKCKGYWVQDCSAAAENLLLAAHFMGLGAVWLGIYPDENRVKGCRDLFGLPAEVMPFALIPLGFPAESQDSPDRFKPDRIRLNTWNVRWQGPGDQEI